MKKVDTNFARKIKKNLEGYKDNLEEFKERLDAPLIVKRSVSPLEERLKHERV